MKFHRISRMFLTLLLASGIQLSLTTCTKSGVIMDSDKEMNTNQSYQEKEVEEENDYYHFGK